MVISRAQQDYLKTIWNLEQTDQPARMKTVAKMLFLKPPTVLSMFRQLSKLGLIRYEKRSGASLTAKGREEAEKIIRKHRLIETFLKKVLKIEEPLLHNEAEKLEHVVSDQLIMKIDEYLNYPITDPHGSIIPLCGSNKIQYALHEMEKDIPFKVVQVPMSGREKTYCAENAFLPGTKWCVIKIGPKGESFLLSNGDNYLAVSDHLADKIKVEIIRD
jgi:Mn-dependent DtxR family transcriptional regulator